MNRTKTSNRTRFGGIFAVAFVAASLALFSCSEQDDATTDIIAEDAQEVIVPIDNENIPAGGTITTDCNKNEIGCGIGNLFDGNKRTNYVALTKSVSLTCTGSIPMTLLTYSITCSATEDAANDPASWTLYGANNSYSYVEIDRRDDVTFDDRGETKIFSVLNNATTYKNYRLTIRKNNGGDKTIVAEWAMGGDVKGDISDLLKYASGYTTSSQTPMGSHYNNAHVATADELAWLADPTTLPDIQTGNDWTWVKGWAKKTVTLYPYGEPIPADINQRAIGDCCMCAVFAGFAYSYPDFIKSIIKDNGDGTFVVKMFDPQGNRIEVAVDSNFLVDNGGNCGQISSKGNVACWTTVMEKALMKWEKIFKVKEDIGGIGTETVVPLFTGDGYSFAIGPNKLTNTQMKRFANTVVDMGYITIGGFNVPDLLCGTLKSVTGHAFTIMHSGNPQYMFVMRNPWGNGNTEDGQLQIPNNTSVPPTIDFRVCNAGIAAPYQRHNIGPYVPPKYNAALELGVSEYLRRTGR